MRTASLSSPDSLDSHYVAKQHRRIQQVPASVSSSFRTIVDCVESALKVSVQPFLQLEEREAMLQDELRQLKVSAEAK